MENRDYFHVFLVWHTHEIEEDNEDIKLLGVYSTEKKAEEAIAVLKKKPGFFDHPEGFEISKYTIDELCWVDGFATVRD